MNFGLIGDGRIAKRHRTAIKRIGGEITSVYDPYNGGCQDLDERFFSGLDYVAICSPTMFHYNHIRAALKHDIRVIVEKPVSLPWQPIINHPNVLTILQLRWCDLPRKAKKIKIVAARNDEYFSGSRGAPLETGGIFFNLFIHYIDLAMRTGAEFEASVISEGKQEKWMDGIDLTLLDMDEAYFRMYQDMIHGIGLWPIELSKLNWLLALYTERFGAGKEIINKQIKIDPNRLI